MIYYIIVLTAACLWKADCKLLSMLHLFLDVDKVVLAKGHAAAAQYAVLYAAKKLNENDLKNYKQILRFRKCLWEIYQLFLYLINRLY